MASKRDWELYSQDETGSDEADSSCNAGLLPAGNGTQSRHLRHLSHVSIAGLPITERVFDGFQPPLALSDESDALQSLLQHRDAQASSTTEGNGYTFIELNDFSFYRMSSRREYSLEGLDVLHSTVLNQLYLRGVVSFSDRSYYIQDVPFSIVTIDGYDDYEIIDLRDSICVQTKLAESHDVWYRLGAPADEYRRFYDPFKWLATFTKFFLEYLIGHNDVTLAEFRSSFFRWVVSIYGRIVNFAGWHAQCGLEDFRTTVAAHFAYLWKECYGLDSMRLRRQPIWKEVMYMTAIPEHAIHEARTVVTPYVYECFKHMYFADQIVIRAPKAEVEDKIAIRKEAMELTPWISDPVRIALREPRITLNTTQQIARGVGKGDVIAIQKDEGESAKWKASASIWYAYVQNTNDTPAGRMLDVLWLYAPEDTTLGMAHYPFVNELFLTDNCSCGTEAIHVEEVIGTVDISLYCKDPFSTPGFFVRQKFRTIAQDDHYDFTTLKPSDFTCSCRDGMTDFEHCLQDYKLGDDVLIRGKRHGQDDALEPAQIIGFKRETSRVIVRRFARKSNLSDDAAPNELLFTDEVLKVTPSKVIRKCQIGLFSTLAEVCHPYNLGGAGDFFYIVGVDDVAMAAANDAYNDKESSEQPETRRVQGLGIFCGGGSFDRGLEEGGSVDFKYAVDLASAALHSYRANTDPELDVRYFLGSVNDYLTKALNGSTKAEIAPIGDVEAMSGGSPCPGFSMMQPDKNSDTSRRNASLVASFVAFVDTYNPVYCVLENVTSMASSFGPNKDQNVFTQILAALVGLGYQVQQFRMDGWSHASPQQRTRLFIVASAPGLQPWAEPPHTHAHPDSLKFYSRNLGRSSNGIPFGIRRDDYTPFSHVSPDEATRDLPDIADGSVGICPRFPDHRIPSQQNNVTRQRIARIPVHPRGMGLVSAVRAGIIASGEPVEYLARSSKMRSAHSSSTHARMLPDTLFPTIITKAAFQDAKNGRYLHWDQHRPISIQEARRAQGYPDHEVIVGTGTDQMKIVGNSVDRKVAFALGLALSKSWSTSERSTRERLIGLPTYASVDDVHVVIPRWEGKVDDDVVEIEDESGGSESGDGISLVAPEGDYNDDMQYNMRQEVDIDHDGLRWTNQLPEGDEIVVLHTIQRSSSSHQGYDYNEYPYTQREENADHISSEVIGAQSIGGLLTPLDGTG